MVDLGDKGVPNVASSLSFTFVLGRARESSANGSTPLCEVLYKHVHSPEELAIYSEERGRREAKRTYLPLETGHLSGRTHIQRLRFDTA